jgi:magnesium-transporting ATPase (P-type)
MSLAVISYLFVVFLTVALLVDIFPFFALIKKVSALSKHSYQIINAANLDDEKKQSQLLFNSFNIFKVSIQILGLIIVIGVYTYLLLIIGAVFKPLSFQMLNNAALSVPGLILSVVAFASYFLLKKLYGKFRV